MRVRAFTTATGGPTAAGSPNLDDSSSILQIGAPVATLFRIRSEPRQAPHYGIGIVIVTETPRAAIEAADGQVVNGQLMKLVAEGGTSVFEWEGRLLHTDHTYSCPLPLVIELDPTMDMEKMTYAFSMDELTTTQHVLEETASCTLGWAALPTVGKPKKGKPAALPLHGDLICTPGGALAVGDIPAASVDGKVECPRCCLKVGAKALVQHMAGHILENEVRVRVRCVQYFTSQHHFWFACMMSCGCARQH